MTLPTATYRLQFRNGFDFGKAAALAPYFARLGVSHVYASPIFRAAPGSTHGYDVADFGEIEPAIGGEQGFLAFAAALRSAGIGLILDFVPNHMGASPFNPWWRDVLEWGQASPFAGHFDIDWSAPKLIVPVLGEAYGRALADGKLGLDLDEADGGVSFSYGDLRLPIAPPSYARILGRLEEESFPELARRFAIADPDTAPELKAELARLVSDRAVAERVRHAIDAVVADHAALHDLHEDQFWRLTFWRAARETLTYRRFFEIADLVGIKVERPKVFEDVHALLLRLVAEGAVDGIRLDHIDGLADPKTYLVRLQGAIGSEAPFYLLVEKILGPGETLRDDWPIAGTTGYEFITALAGLFMDPARAAEATAAYERFIGSAVDYEAMVLDTKRRILSRNLAGELEFLKQLGCTLSAGDPMTRDIGADSLRRAVMEIAAALPVYRTYVNVEGPAAEDLALIENAMAAARTGREVEDESAIDFVGRMLRLDFADPASQATALEFATRFQQTTGPVMAKALEDTLFYRFNRLVALNEVGGEPDRFGASREDFHQAMRTRLGDQPGGLSATATHDTKRGEDARARLYVLGEVPGRWAAAAERWRVVNSGLRTELDDGTAPEPAMEWLFYQALAGAWPADLDPRDRDGLAALAERLDAYMTKVVREAKLRTSWTTPSPTYEDAVSRFVKGALAPDHWFAADFAATCAPIWTAGALNGLSQLAIKLCAPGVPDIYQGTETWDLSLVDPDNRRPVAYDALQALLTAAEAPGGDPLADWRSGAPKLRLMRSGLALRRERPDLFGKGEYFPLDLAGRAEGHALAFARRHGEDAVIVVASRLATALVGSADLPLVPPGAWSDAAVVLPAALAGRTWRDAVTGAEHGSAGTLALREVLARFPAAILVAQPLS
ncbi:malto-oligosyltrehalose synthase [Propylenella binzhouense]|uniref:Malto-oligosyltrehalose synthase n=1 Tax=Propylenella binzhouense TaxID=2555902 RepID=A0A964WTK4_9HYPH|nr:malto-oligosyltrehalose synthase [Propylenella binzhouense]MYZ47945.1 malto-oligosyltrehalose synthase [Propylenella binzhouense]